MGGGGTRTKGPQRGLPGRTARDRRDLDGLAGAGAGGGGGGGGGCKERQQQHQQEGAAAAGARQPHRVRRGVALQAAGLSSGSGSALPRLPPPPEADSFSPQSPSRGLRTSRQSEPGAARGRCLHGQSGDDRGGATWTGAGRGALGPGIFSAEAGSGSVNPALKERPQLWSCWGSS